MMGPLSDGLPNQTTVLMLHMVRRLQFALTMITSLDAAAKRTPHDSQCFGLLRAKDVQAAIRTSPSCRRIVDYAAAQNHLLSCDIFN
jgi:hypothetical protein